MTTVIQGSAGELRTAMRTFEMIAAAGDKGFRAKVKELAEAQARLEATQAALAKHEAGQKEEADELVRLKADIERRDVELKQRLVTLDAGAAALQERIAAAETAATRRDGELNVRKARIERQEAALAEAKTALDEMQGVLAKSGTGS